MTLPPPQIWPPRSAEEYQRDKSPPFVLVAIGVLGAFGLMLIAIGYFMHGEPLVGFMLVIAVAVVVVGILHLGSGKMKPRWFSSRKRP